MGCLTIGCALMAWGYAVPVSLPPKDVGSVALASGRIEVEEPAVDPFMFRCKDGRFACHANFTTTTRTDWGDSKNTLPQVEVYEPRRPPKKRKAVARTNGAGATGTAVNEPSKSIPAQIAEQLARQGVQYVAQLKGAAIGAGIGAVGGPGGVLAGAIIGGWIGCTIPKYGFIRYDWASKERWDLHPEKDLANVQYATKMCSPIGFYFRYQEETEPYKKFFALAGGLSWSPELYSSLAGQIAPGMPTVIDNFKLVFSAFNFSAKKTIFGQQREAYHNGEAWEAR